MASIIEALNTTTIGVTNHPFYPLEVEIANYLANEWSMQVLLTIFTAVCATIFFGTRYLVNRVHPHLPSSEKAAIWWFVLCKFFHFLPIEQSCCNLGDAADLVCVAGSIHLFFEGTHVRASGGDCRTYLYDGQDTSLSTTRAWGLRRTYLANYGKNMHSLIPDT